jgi:transcriptional regulator with XRE-family HTH domain
MTLQKPQTVVDAHVGQRLIELRKKMELSQTDIAKILGVTYQQVQKYEHGTSRLGVEKIKILSKHFKISNSYFFEEFNSVPVSFPIAIASGDEVLSLLSLFFHLKSPELRQELLETAHSLIERQATANQAA